MPQPYQIQFTEDFFSQSHDVPKAISKKLPEKWDHLRVVPRHGANIKRVRGGPRGLYRLRIGDYRVIYGVKDEPPVVSLLRVGHRRRVYDGLPLESKTPTVVVVTGHASITHQPSEPPPKHKSPTYLQPPRPPSNPLPEDFCDHVEDLGIPEPHRSVLLNCCTEDELENAEVPEDIQERVIEKLWPSPLDELLDVPKRVVDSAEDLLAAVDGSRTLESFLLALDENQKPLVAQFRRHPNGPWLVKGGPGTGKSTVALYCVRNLLHPDKRALPIVRKPLRILFTTYTRSLVAVSAYLLNALECDTAGLEVLNVDKLAWRYRGPGWARCIYYGGKGDHWTPFAEAAIGQCYSKHTSFAFGRSDLKFLYNEVNQVILGNQITSLAEYRGFSRVGRGRPLGQRQRERVWAFFKAVDREANRLGHGLPGHVFDSALKRVRPTYDYVFVDEAQDLLPVAIRMCVALAKDSRNVFLTADRNQSIYTSGFSWKKVEDSLDFRGRTRILRRNYRTTREIMNGLRPLLRDDEETDEDTRFSEPLRRGPSPELRWGSKANEGQIAGQWVIDICQEEDLGFRHAAVLCPTNQDCLRLAKQFQYFGLNASAMMKGGVDLSFDGVKVLTMHNAKGLEFPIVAVVGLACGRMPWTDPNDPTQREEMDKLQRAFFVACSRAMRRLLVVADQNSPSPFVCKFDREHWRTAD